MEDLERGDVLAHPHHGPVEVQEFAERRTRDGVAQYVVLAAIGSDLRIKVPVDGLERLGVRHLVTPERLQEVLGELRGETRLDDPRWTNRLKDAQDLLATGSLVDAAIVARDLSRRARARDSALREDQLKVLALRRVVLEVSLVRGIDEEAATQLVEAAIFGDEHGESTDASAAAHAA